MTSPDKATAVTASPAGQLHRLARRPTAGFVVGAAVGLLGGMIGLGGAEFRLPLLISLFGFAALQAVILNKAMSLAVVITALPARLVAVPAGQLAAHWPVAVNLLAGSLCLAIALPTMLLAFTRYSRSQAFTVLRGNGWFLAAMTGGSITGALLGALLLGIIPNLVLIPALALLLLASAVKLWRH